MTFYASLSHIWQFIYYCPVGLRQTVYMIQQGLTENEGSMMGFSHIAKQVYVDIVCNCLNCVQSTAKTVFKVIPEK